MCRYKYLIFDMDNTLINYDLGKIKTYKDMAKNFIGKPITDKEALKLCKFEENFWAENNDVAKKGPQDKACVDDVMYRMTNGLWGNSKEDTYVYYNKFLELMANHIYPYKGVKRVIKKLSTKYKIIIASNGDRELIEKKIKVCGITQYVDKIILAGRDTLYYKPNINFFNYCMQEIGCTNKSKILVIGDSLHTDIDGATSAGIDSIWFNHNYRFKEEPYVHHDTIEIHNLCELLNYL